MPSVSIKLPVTKGTDRDYFEALRSIKQSEQNDRWKFSTVKMNIQGLSANNFEFNSLEDADASDALQQLLDAEGRVFKTLKLNGEHITIQFRRTDDFSNGTTNGLEDELALSLAERASDLHVSAFPMLIAFAQNACRTFSVANLTGLLGEHANQHFQARESALTRLESALTKSLYQYERLRKSHFEEIEQKHADLEAQAQEQREQLDSQYSDRMKLVDERQAKLDEEKKKLDDRSSTHVRRELREKLKEILKERQTSFALSADTGRRRRHVVLLYVLALAAIGSIAGISIYQDYSSTSGTTDYWLLGRLAASTLGFFVFLGFFIRWVSNWAHQNAEEEFKLRQLDLDIDRASWLVEMAFEWDEAKQAAIPETLIEILSANLFGQSLKTDVSTSPADAIAKLLSGLPAGAAEIVVPGGKITFDRKALAKVRKDSNIN